MNSTRDITASGFAALSAAPLFKDIPEQATRDIFAAARPISLRKGQRLFGYGDAGGSMFVVVKGIIEISISTASGRKISLNMMSQGNCFGEISMLDGGSRSAAAVALAASSLLSIPRAAFLASAGTYPELALALAVMLSERVRWISDSVEDYALLPLDRRLARRILILFDRFGGADNVIGISQGDLADFAGATRESTNKILADWRRRGWISMSRKHIALLDRDSLDQFAMSPRAG